jgi:hypothetical protein
MTISYELTVAFQDEILFSGFMVQPVNAAEQKGQVLIHSCHRGKHNGFIEEKHLYNCVSF